MPRLLARLAPLALLILAAGLIVGCASTEDVVAAPTFAEGDSVVIVAVPTSLTGLDDTGLQTADSRIGLRVLQILDGSQDMDRATAAITDDVELPPELRSERRLTETVVRVTLVQQADGLAATDIHRYDLRKFKCFVCGRQLQGLRMPSEEYEIIRWFCPAHGYRDVTMEEL